MALSYKSRRRWSMVLLLVWLPVYIIVAITLLAYMPEIHKILQLLLFAFLGVAWALPFKFVFKGVGKEDPEASDDL